MAVLTFPSITPDIQTFGITYNTQIAVSNISGYITRVELPGARWNGSLTFTDMTASESAALKAFLLELRGAAGEFYYGDLSHDAPFNTITGSVTVQTGSTERVLTVAGNTGDFSVGDYIQVGTDENRELKMVIAVSGSDLTIEPLMRRTDYVDLEVVYTNPRGKFMLTSDEQANWAIRSKALLSDINLDFVEVF